MADLLRTTSFRVPAALLGTVHAYRPGARFLAAWQRLEDAKGDRWQLPHASLAVALRVMTRDFVRLKVRTRPGEDPFFIVSRQPLAPAMLREALLAWETAVFPGTGGNVLREVADDLHAELVPVGEYVQRRPGRCPVAAAWVFEAGVWELAYRLASKPLAVDDGHAALSIDTDGNLLTWGRPSRGGSAANYLAMHRIVPRLITVPGIEDLVVHLDASFVRLANKWSAVRNAWLRRPDGDGLLLCFGVRHGPAPEYRPVWEDLAAPVLRRTWHGDFPEADEVDLRQREDDVRAVLPRAWDGWALGKGPGQLFHGYVGSHGKQLLAGCEPLEFRKAVRQLPRREELAPTSPEIVAAAAAAGDGRPPRLVCLYATPPTRRRMTAGLASIVGSDLAAATPGDGEVWALNGVEVVFRSPRGAPDVLTQVGPVEGIRRWVLDAVAADAALGAGVSAVLVETEPPEREESDGEVDPKFVIRRALAERGMVTQFLAGSSAPDNGDEDHAASSAAWDLLRSRGMFPAEFPALPPGIAIGTWLVGVYVVRLNARRLREVTNGRRHANGERFLVSLVAVEAGGRRALGYGAAGWLPLARATAAFFTADSVRDVGQVPQYVDQAVHQLLVRDPKCRAVVYMEAGGCARFWSGLADKGDTRLPAFANGGRAAVVRIRANPQHVPRPAGTGPWPGIGSEAQRPGEINALVQLARPDWDEAMFYASTPRVMNRMGAHRRSTRFTADARDLRRDWHALNMTEFSCRHRGPFIPEDLYQLTALLCRQAPTWDGTLNWPSPLHLARAIVADHPGRYLENEAGEGNGG
jgi:hypothetical protein